MVMKLSIAARLLIPVVLLTGFACSLVGFTGCGSNDASKATDSIADAETLADTLHADSIVEGMYRLFIDKRYDEYVKMQAGCDGKPKEYVDQTVLLMKLLRERQDTLHRGPKGCRLVRYERHGDDYFDAFLEVEFNDTTSEVILLPMIRQNGKWRQR